MDAGTGLQTGLATHPSGMVPLDPENRERLESAREAVSHRERVGEGLSAFLIRLRNEINDLDRHKRLNLFRTMIKAHQYMDGNFYGYVDENCEWQSRTKDPNEVWYSDNQVYAYWRTALMELSRSQTEIVIEAPDGASEEIVSAAKFAQTRYDANRARTFNSLLKQTENAYALLNGITYRYTFFEFRGGDQRKEKMPVVQRGEDNAQTVKICAQCSKPALDMSDIGDMPKPTEQKCHSCGSTMFREIDASGGPDVVIGYEDLPTGSNSWMVPNPIGIVVSMQASSIRETPFLLWRQPILRGVLQNKYPGVELMSTGIESTELRYIVNQQTSFPNDTQTRGGWNTNGDGTISQAEGTGRELEVLEFHQLWLDYPLYCDKKFSEDQPLGRGKVLKAGQPLGSIFKKGLYAAFAGEVVLDLWNEDKNRKWTSTPYGMRPGSMYGTGSAVVLSDQELINDLKTLTMANAWSNGVPREFVDPEYISELSADPLIPTNITKPMGDTGHRIVGRAYDQAPATPLSAEIYGIADKAEASIQNKIGAMSSGAGGLHDAQKWGDTATAISIKRDLAVGRFSPDLMLMADMLDKEQAVQFLQNEQEFFTPGQWEQYKGEHGAAALEAFQQVDVTQDLLISVAPGSYMPKSDAQLQAKLIAYTEILGVMANINDPELIAYAAETFGVPAALGGWNSDRVHANRTVDKILALAELYVQQYGDLPTTDLDDQMVMFTANRINEFTKVPVDVFLDNHDALIDSYRDWRTTDQGRDSSNAALAAVALRTTMHIQAKGKQAQLLAATEMMAQQPLQIAAQAEQAQAAQQQAAMAEEQAAAEEPQQIAQAMGQVLEFDDREQQREHEAQMQAAQLGTDREIARHTAA